MGISVTHLRANIYKLIDEVIASGKPLEVERNGVVVKIMPPGGRDLEGLLPPREDLVVGDPEDLVHLDWSGSWNPEANL